MKERSACIDQLAWLETDSPAVREWQADQSRLADRKLAELASETQLERMTELCGASMRFAPQRHGNRWFCWRSGSEGMVLSVADEAAGPWSTIIDPSTYGEGTSLDYVFPSPSGRLVAFGTSSFGDEQSILRVFDLEQLRLLDLSIPFTSNGVVAWMPAEDGFFYSGGERADFEDVTKFLFRADLTNGTVGREPCAVREQYSLRPQVSQDGRWLAAVTSEIMPRPDLIRALPDGNWRPFLVDVPAACYGVFVGDHYIAITTLGAPRGRLVSIPIATAGDLNSWVELIPESERVMRSIELLDERLAISWYEDSFARLSIHRLDGSLDHEVILPGDGVIRTLGLLQHYQLFGYGGDNVAPCGRQLTFTFATFTDSPATYLYDLRSRSLELLESSAVTLADLTHRRLTATAPDGTSVRYSIVHRADLSRGEPQPAFIYGYGGFNVSFIPGFLGPFADLVEKGAIFVFAHLRGGAEFGAEQWQAGRFAEKRHSWDDLFAIADDLVSRGLSSSDRLGIIGASGGGLLASGAIAKRPDQWRAAVIMVPLSDLLNFARDPYASVCSLDLGHPADPRARAWLADMSPYHSIVPANYPATLIMAAGRDMRTFPWHARKLAARLQEANLGEHPILLRIFEEEGHFGSFLDPQRCVAWSSFLEHELGLDARDET